MTKRITTAFTAASTAAEVIEGIDLSGKRVIVTGASSGIRVETARALASAGAAVTLAVRNVEAGMATADDIVASTGAARPDVVAPLLSGIGGRYFEDCNEAAPNVAGTRSGVAAHALDPEAAERLWRVSVETLAG